MKTKSNCEYCVNYVYDDDYGCYTCQVSLDQDEMSKFLTKTFDNCPYFQLNDEYKTSRKQM